MARKLVRLALRTPWPGTAKWLPVAAGAPLLRRGASWVSSCVPRPVLDPYQDAFLPRAPCLACCSPERPLWDGGSQIRACDGTDLGFIMGASPGDQGWLHRWR